MLTEKNELAVSIIDICFIEKPAFLRNHVVQFVSILVKTLNFSPLFTTVLNVCS